MSLLAAEAYGPLGDSSSHRSLAELEAGPRALPQPPRDAGRVPAEATHRMQQVQGRVRGRRARVRPAAEDAAADPARHLLAGLRAGRRPARGPDRASLARLRSQPCPSRTDSPTGSPITSAG